MALIGAFFISANICNADDISTSTEYSQSFQESCQPEWISPPQTLPLKGTLPNAEADSISQDSANDYRLFGDVIVEQPGRVLLSDEIIIKRQQKTAEAFGKVELHQKEMMIVGSRAYINDTTQKATLDQARFQFMTNRSHGRAQHIDIDQNDRLAELEQASFTTCKLESLKWQARDGHIKEDTKYPWELDFSHLRIDDAKRRIYGHHAILYFQKVPVFYSPYLDFPLEKRASGFLFPQLGSYKSITQNSVETYLTLPYYINIAPEVDDTVTVTYMEKRGVVLGNELRYLQPKHSATLNTHYISDNITAKEGIAFLDANGDLQYTDPVRDRWDAHLIARQQWTPNLRSNINWREISDENFYADVPVDPILDTATNVARSANIQYQYNDFNAHITMLDYLRLRKSAPYNYEKRPEIGAYYSHYFEDSALENFTANLMAEATEFEISYSDHKKPEATRTYVSPSVDYAIYKSYGHMKAEIVANRVNYQMEDNGYNNTGADEHNITVPQYALNTGLNFERDLKLFDFDMVQTLEPKLQYLYVPYQDQSDIPLFDTIERSLDFSNLFNYNRFSGYDRIGDANQISAALTTRFLQPDGTPIAEAGLGQIFYLQDRKVQLNASDTLPPSNTAGVSDYFVKIGFNAYRINFYSTSQFSYLNYQLTNSNSRLKLDLSPQFTFLLTNTAKNLNQSGEKEDIAAGFNWQINDNWALGSYWNYDFTANRKSEMSSAIRYDSCCWASELSVKEEQLGNGLYNYSVQYLIEFKGLSSVGTPFNKYLTDKLNF